MPKAEVPGRHTLRRRPRESMRQLRLPSQTVFSEDLSAELEVLGALQEGGAHDDFVAHDGLVVVGVGGAVRAVVAVDVVSWGGGC